MELVGIIARRGEQKIQQLHQDIIGALEHNVKELPVWLGMQLFEDHPVGIGAVLVLHIRRQHLVGGVGRFIH